MKSKSESERRERQDWLIVLLLLLLGFLCVIVAAQWALRFSPSWKLNTDMGSNIDPNSSFLTDKPVGFIEPVDAAILTKPAWVKVFLTPGAKFVTGTPPLAGQANNVSTEATTAVPVINTLAVTNTIPVSTSTIAPTNTFVWLPLPATKPPKPKDTSVPPADTPTNTSPPPTPNANLVVTMTDNAEAYAPGTSRTYSIQVSNLGPDNITGAVIRDNFPTQITGFTAVGPWCVVTVGSATCGTWSGSGNINDTVDLPAGSSLIYQFQASTNADLVNLVNAADVSVPGGYIEAAPGNEAATDTDFVISSVVPGGMATPGDSNYTTLTAPFPQAITFPLSSSITVDGNSDWDLVYYEELQGGDVLMDVVIIEIGDGYNWYPVLNWGNGSSDTNTEVSLSAVGAWCPAEVDNCAIPSGALYNNTGIRIDVDGAPSAPPNGAYPYIRITAPAAGDVDGSIKMDAILPYP